MLICVKIRHLERDVDAAEKVVLVAGTGRLGDLLEETAETFDTADFVQFANGVQHRILVVVIPVFILIELVFI